MDLRLYNTLTRKKKSFKPVHPGRVGMYVCGPTVYDRAHIGNARPVIVFDVLYRLLRHIYGAENVTYVRNITDVDDKINAAAKESGEPIESLTKHTTALFHADMAALGALPPDHEPRATQHIAGMIDMAKTLIERGHAYEAEGHVLFHVPSMSNYGGLSHRSLDEMIAGARVEVAPYKKHPADFVLWKPSTPDLPGWDSPWGRGRPGWHLECSVMSEKFLGVPIDIHGGGQDLIFPHHENERAQTLCVHDIPKFANYWMHNGYVIVEGEKMSKSLGNFLTVEDVLSRVGDKEKGEVVRFALLSAHYRKPLDVTGSLLEQSKAILDRWYRAVEACGDVVPTYPEPSELGVSTFFEALGDDLNTQKALGELQRQVDQILGIGDTGESMRQDFDYGELRGRLLMMGNLLGLLQQKPEDWFKGSGDVVITVPAAQLRLKGYAPEVVVTRKDKIGELIRKRTAARKAKNFAEADRIRKELAEKGIVLEDKPDGTTEWRVE